MFTIRIMRDDEVFAFAAQELKEYLLMMMPEELTDEVILQWCKIWKGTVYTFEYHFWHHQFLDPGVFSIGKRLYEDIRSLRFCGIDSYVEDGSQRNGWPNAFPVYIYAETLMNRNCDFEAVRDNYFAHTFSKYEIEMERYYDHSLACRVTEHITTAPKGIILI